MIRASGWQKQKNYIRVAALAMLGLATVPAAAQTIVWTDANARKIQSKDVNGGSVQTIVELPASQEAYQIHYDPIAAKFYYRSSGTPSGFRRMNADGSDLEEVLTPTWGIFVLDFASRKLYWGSFDDTALYRSELNGSGVQSHVYADCCLDPVLILDDVVYLSGRLGVTKGLWRADSDGSNEELIYPSGRPTGAGFESVEGKLYVATGANIYKLNRDGTGFAWVIPNSVFPEYLVVDERGHKLYWTDRGARIIKRSNLDGSDVEDFVIASETGNPELDLAGLTIVFNSEPVPTVSQWGIVGTAAIFLTAGSIVLKNRRNFASKAAGTFMESVITAARSHA